MATYFDPDADATLIAPDVRTANELPSVAEIAEADVVAGYTQQIPDSADGWRSRWPEYEPIEETGYAVFLRGYKADADDEHVDPLLRRALKQTIADVVTWRLRADRRGDPTLQRDTSRDGKNRTFFYAATYTFPPNWRWRLRPFDTRVKPVSF